ncbi:GDSL lipase/acylhydrolase family protein [Paracoccidioides lutzii Pb01]|uniref:GDSL lipase/acylhydrolase family protein n=1 Tax=Paracoccidioides lutzii (strain ATCC MYA-826 / Pb01) TaxID=502779 RepID=C1H440_PARBA|nr:GDSL lipase/acylhydrolase family protein [Paracoccidioides lutzii Pb01]EEH34484.2 GDSL lipase/acylhydrolase family protein [Paracoccidioides lutzii Pb01]
MDPCRLAELILKNRATIAQPAATTGCTISPLSLCPSPTHIKIAPQNDDIKIYNYTVKRRSLFPKNNPLYLLDILVPSYLEYQIPTYFADSAHHHDDPHYDPTTTPSNQTVYSSWIYTNNLANNSFLSYMEIPNHTNPDSVDCILSALD